MTFSVSHDPPFFTKCFLHGSSHLYKTRWKIAQRLIFTPFYDTFLALGTQFLHHLASSCHMGYQSTWAPKKINNGEDFIDSRLWKKGKKIKIHGLEDGSNEPMYKKGWLLICTDFDWILVFFGVYHTLKKPSLRIFAENISGTGNSKYGKWGWNLHFQKHHIFYLWFCSDLIFLVFWFLRFLCKFIIPRKQGTKKSAEKVAKNDILKKKCPCCV